MTDAELSPWKDDPDFIRMMHGVERNNPMGPMGTYKRRLLYWRIRNELPAWQVPDDPFDMEAWQ